jgi:hypothetical protein
MEIRVLLCFELLLEIIKTRSANNSTNTISSLNVNLLGSLWFKI